MGQVIKQYTYIALAIFFFSMELYPACTPSGTPGDDNVSCTGSITSFQFLYGGSDIVTLDHVTPNVYGNTYWLDESLGGNPATDGNDTFIAHNSSFYWVLGFGGDDRFEVYDSNFSNLYGDTNPGHGTSQRGNDTIYVEHSISNGYILGGNDSDSIVIVESNVSNVASGYSDIYSTDYTPFDTNDTILLDHVNFNVLLYWDNSQIEGVVTGGRGDDMIIFQHGGEAYYVYGGHGSDTIDVYDGEHFNPCPSSHQDPARCGIYGDVDYASEQNISAIPLRHGDDTIRLHDADLRHGYLQGGDGSDVLSIYTPVLIEGSTLDGGDDCSAADGFVDRVEFEQWSGDLNGSQFHNWEQIRLHDASAITWLDDNISIGIENGIDASSGLPYGLIVDDNSRLNFYHDFTIDGNLHNGAIVDLQDGNASGTVLKIEGDYTASSGQIYLDTVLSNASPSISDMLVVKGSTSGDSVLKITNIEGTGGQTPIGDNSGILVVEVHGDSNGTFTLDSPLQAGDYWYRLIKGSNGNWYLQSIKAQPSLKVTKESDTKTIIIQYNTSGEIISFQPQTIHYTIKIGNTGNIPLDNIVVQDKLLNGTFLDIIYQSGDLNNDNVLDPQEIWIYTTVYTPDAKSLLAQPALTNSVIVNTSAFTNMDTFTASSENSIHISGQKIICTPTPTPTPALTIVPTPTPTPSPEIPDEPTDEQNCSCSDYKSDSVGVEGYALFCFFMLFIGMGRIMLAKED